MKIPASKIKLATSQESSRYTLQAVNMAVAVLILTAGSLACTSSTSSDYQASSSAPQCVEPANPYEEGSGHYAGFEWAEEHPSAACDGNSDSFNEGCEEYQQQEQEYEDCEAHRVPKA